MNGIYSKRRRTGVQSSIDLTSLICLYSLRKLNQSYYGPAMLVKRFATSGTPTGNNTFRNIHYNSSGSIDTNEIIYFANNIAETNINIEITTWYDQASSPANLAGSGSVTICENNSYLGYANLVKVSATPQLNTSSTKISNSITGKISSQHIVGKIVGGYGNNDSLLVYAGTQFTRNTPAGTNGYGFFGDGTYGNAAFIDNTTFSSLSTVFKLHSGQVNYNTPITIYSINDGAGFGQSNTGTSIPNGSSLIINSTTASAGYHVKEIIVYNKYMNGTDLTTFASNVISYYSL